MHHCNYPLHAFPKAAQKVPGTLWAAFGGGLVARNGGFCGESVAGREKHGARHHVGEVDAAMLSIGLH